MLETPEDDEAWAISLDTRAITCAVCDVSSLQIVLVGGFQAGGCDLDLRPSETLRSTMSTWVQECLNCGLCAASLDDPPAGASEAVLRTRDYLDILHGPARMPHLARQFRAESLLIARAGDLDLAAQTEVCAAWACDDAGDVEAAIASRNRAIAWLLRATDNKVVTWIEGHPATRDVLLIDLLRRARRFREAREACYLVLQAPHRPYPTIARYQLALIDMADSGMHRIDDAVSN